jgi:hypothetical protein
MKIYLIIIFAGCFKIAGAQIPDFIYMPNVHSVKLYLHGNQLEYPIIALNSSARIELEFDDLDGDVKNYYYTYQLCNADWTPVQLSTMDYIRGFAQNPITEYQFSSVALVRYTHYHITIPENSSRLTLSGNYLVKVFLNNDTSKIAFTKRLLVVENEVGISAQILPPMNPETTLNSQKLQFTVNSKALYISNPFQQIHVVVLQNNRWDNAIYMGNPSFYSGTNFEYNSDDIPVFPGGNQWRWLDLQSFRYQSDRIARADYQKNGTVIFVKPDKERADLSYYYYADNNGGFIIETTDLINPNWQGDYASVLFSYIPPDNIAFAGQDLYLLGEFTGYRLNESSKMTFNPAKGIYEGSAFLKMGYYNYCYVTVNTGSTSTPSFDITEGNHFETENDYRILVYYRSMGGRADQLVGVYSTNTLNALK